MAIRLMLAPLGGAEEDASFLDTVFTLAKNYGAHVDVLHVALDPRDAVAFVGEGMTAAMIEQIMQAADREGASRGEKAEAAFRRVVERHGSPVRDTPTAAGYSARFLRRTGREDEVVAERGRLADLIAIAIPAAQPRSAPSFTLDACIRETGRPVLIVPSPTDGNATFGKRIAIAWNGSTESGRAIRAAMPFLEKAEQVTVLSIGEGATATPTGPEVIEYLGWCGVAAEHVVLPVGQAGAPKALLDGVVACKADMLVMGAYTRSQMRRLIFGGITAEVLAATAVPVLMVH